jgi:pilus assembly protein CpaB
LFSWMKRDVRSFFSGRWSVRTKELYSLGIGVLLTGLALAAAVHRISAVEQDLRQKANPVEVVVASTPIAPGETFSSANLARKPIPASGTGKRNVPASEFELLLGASSRNPVGPGEPVLWTDVQEPFEIEAFSKTVAAGQRAFTVAVDAISSFAGLLRPGDRVDLLSSDADGKGAVWIRNIPVIAVDRHLDRLAAPAESTDASTVTLMVTPAEGARIARAGDHAKFHWFLRNPEDNVPARRGNIVKHVAPPAVEIWKGGVRMPGPTAGREVTG